MGPRRAPAPAWSVHGLLVATVLAGVVAWLAAAPAAAVEADGVRVDPSEPSALGAGSVLRPAIAPGGSARYALTVRNQRDRGVEVLVYGADAPEGVVADGTDNTGVGRWVEVAAEDQRVTLAPGGATPVQVTIARPSDDTDGGTGAIVVQLSEDTRQRLELDRVRRAALLVEVAADGTGTGVLPTVEVEQRRTGLLPGELVVTVELDNPGTAPAEVDASVTLDRLLSQDTAQLELGSVEAGSAASETVVVPLPWYGAAGRVRVEAGLVPVVSVSPAVRVVAVPPWSVLVLVVAAAGVTLRERRRRAGTEPSAPLDSPPTDD